MKKSFSLLSILMFLALACAGTDGLPGDGNPGGAVGANQASPTNTELGADVESSTIEGCPDHQIAGLDGKCIDLPDKLSPPKDPDDPDFIFQSGDANKPDAPQIRLQNAEVDQEDPIEGELQF